jgi:hypothetical protein
MNPESYELVRSTFNLTAENDWRYSWLQELPNVTAPPAKFKIDPYYTKFTWAREFTVLGRGASDAALLKANEIIRKMFSYRHDLLKTLINNGARLVVLGRGEKIGDFPRGETNRLAVSESDLRAIIPLFAKAFYEATAERPVDPNWEKRGQEVQQYELRVTRLDVRFGERVKQLAMAADAKNAGEYWATGVAAYFDAGAGSISTREKLKERDPGLHALVHETMAYEDRPDWRYQR